MICAAVRTTGTSRVDAKPPPRPCPPLHRPPKRLKSSNIQSTRARTKLHGWPRKSPDGTEGVPSSPEAACSTIGVDDDPNGHYIITPGRHRIDINDFMMEVDRRAVQGHAESHPAYAASCSYANDIHSHWRTLENFMNPGAFMVSFPAHTDIEEFRKLVIQQVFEYMLSANLALSTVHGAVMNVNRLLFHRVWNSSALCNDLLQQTVINGLRTAIKVDETVQHTDRLRLRPEEIWQLGKKEGVATAGSLASLNKVETECMKILEFPLAPAKSVDFLERYMVVGEWPQHCMEKYRDLAAYLLGLSLFVHGSSNPLRGVPPSKLAAAALVLAIKVNNADSNGEAYEFWPRKLETYTQYGLATLRPVVRGLSVYLRKKPPHARVLNQIFPRWSLYDWD